MPEFIDLSREIFHRTQTHPSHPPAVVTVWGDHSEKPSQRALPAFTTSVSAPIVSSSGTSGS